MSASMGDEDDLREPITDVEVTLASGPPEGMAPFVDDLSATDDPRVGPPTLPPPRALEPPAVPALVAANLPRATRDRGIFGCESSARFDVLEAAGYQVMGIWTSERSDAPGHAICRRQGELYFAKVAPADTRTIAGRRLHNEMVMTCAFVERGRRRELGHRIAAPVDVGYEGDTAYLVQQHIPGVSLERLLRASLRSVAPSPLSIAQVVHIARHTALALDAVHRVTDDDARPAQLVHADVAPRSVLVGEAGEVRLVSWGFACRAGQLWQDRELTLGSLEALSPEHVRSAPLQQSSDLFALGRLLWQMLSGRWLFDLRVPREAVASVLAPLPRLGTLRPDLPAALEQLLFSLTALQPEERCASAAEVIARLDALDCGPAALDELAERVRSADGRSWELITKMREPARLSLDDVVVPVPYGRSFMLEDLPFDGVVPAVAAPRMVGSSSDHVVASPLHTPPVPAQPVRPPRRFVYLAAAAVVGLLGLWWPRTPDFNSRTVGVPFLELERGLLATSTLSPELTARLDRAREALDRPGLAPATEPGPAAASFVAGGSSASAVTWLRSVRTSEQERRRVVLSQLDALVRALPDRSDSDTPELAVFVGFMRTQLSVLSPRDAERLHARMDSLSTTGADRADAEQASAEFTAALLGLDP